MRTVWEDNGKPKSVVSPVSLIITGFAPVSDVTKTLTPQITPQADSRLLFVDLSGGATRLGGSALAQAYGQSGAQTPDADPTILSRVFTVFTELKKQGKILAYHDRSDGGLFATLTEMAFAGRCGFDVDTAGLAGNDIEKLFSEELGFVIQVHKNDAEAVQAALGQATNGHAHNIGKPRKSQTLTFRNGKRIIYENTRAELESWWSSTSYQIQSLRDNPACAEQEFKAIQDDKDPGLTPAVPFTVTSNTYANRPKIAIFREQGVNGQIEMAAAFDRAGFTSVDVHLNDIIAGTQTLEDFTGLVACGGFSYGDVLGAGEGWAKTILFDTKLRTAFSDFFAREDTFTLGVCNGCQMLSALKELIPGANEWPSFLRNTSEQFEARVALTRISESPSILLKGMAGAVLPVPVAHGEGRAVFDSTTRRKQALSNKLVAMQYVDGHHEVTEVYPANPNGSTEGITALTTADGRATIMMPHPERAFLTRQLSWHPDDWSEDSPWMQLFLNARVWVAQQQGS